jgi:Protein of unknown function DUF262
VTNKEIDEMPRRPNVQPKNEDDAKALDSQIDIERNNLRTDKIDLSYGELASMYENYELKITPEYQRLFRWSEDQRASFIESLLLGFPIPAIFVAESEDGVWELVDGLQRLSAVFEYLGVLRDAENNLISPSRLSFSVTDGHKLALLNGFTFESLSLRSRLSLKRAYCRVEIIKVGSAPNMKCDVFERLNTGGSKLEPQEIRNAIFRATDPLFMKYCDDLAEYAPFKDALQLSENQQQSMFDRGLVLRFFTLKNNSNNFDHDVEPFITSYVKRIVSGGVKFLQTNEKLTFEGTFRLIWDALGEDAWRHQRQGKPKGGFSVYVFDSLSIGVARNLQSIEKLPPEEIAKRCNAVKESAAFRDSVGPGANTRAKMIARLDIADQIIGNGTRTGGVARPRRK